MNGCWFSCSPQRLGEAMARLSRHGAIWVPAQLGYVKSPHPPVPSKDLHPDLCECKIPSVPKKIFSGSSSSQRDPLLRTSWLLGGWPEAGQL